MTHSENACAAAKPYLRDPNLPFRSILTHHSKPNNNGHITYKFVNAPFGFDTSTVFEEPEVCFLITDLYDQLLQESIEVKQSTIPVLTAMCYTNAQDFLMGVKSFFNKQIWSLLEANRLNDEYEVTYSKSPDFLDFAPWARANNLVEAFHLNKTFVCEQYITFSESKLYRGEYTGTKCSAPYPTSISPYSEDLDETTMVDGAIYQVVVDEFKKAFSVFEAATNIKFIQSSGAADVDVVIQLYRELGYGRAVSVIAIDDFKPSSDGSSLITNSVTLYTPVSYTKSNQLPFNVSDYAKTILHAVGHGVNLAHIRDTVYNQDLPSLKAQYNCTSLMSYEEEPECPYGLTGLDIAALDYLYPSV